MRPGRPALVAGAVWAGLALAPLAVDEWTLLQLAQFITYGIFAMSLALVWGRVGLLVFGHAIFFGAGAYAMSVVTLGMLPGLQGWTSSWLGLVAAAARPAAVANLLGRFLFYGRGLHGAYLAIVTLAFAIIAERAAVNWTWIGGFTGLMNVPPLALRGFGIDVELLDPLPSFYAMLAAALAVYAVLSWLLRTPYGTVLAAIRDNETRAGFFGYDTGAYKLSAFTIAAAVAGLAGGLFVTQFAFAAPSLLGFALSTEVLIWVALGGKSLLLAAFLGALVVRTAEGLLSEALGAFWLLALGALFVLSVVFFPRGLIGEALLWASRPRRARD